MRLLLIALFILFYACGKSNSVDESNPVEQAYSNCVKQTIKQLRNNNKGKKFPPQVWKALEKSAESTCQIIKRECEKNPDGPVCQGLLKKYGQK